MECVVSYFGKTSRNNLIIINIGLTAIPCSDSDSDDNNPNRGSK